MAHLARDKKKNNVYRAVCFIVLLCLIVDERDLETLGLILAVPGLCSTADDLLRACFAYDY